MSDLQNLKVTFKKGGWENYKTKYDGTAQTKFMVGQKKDYKKSHEESGNFQIAVPEKGMKKQEWKWEDAEYDRERFVQYYSYFVKTPNSEGWLELSWSANKAFKEVVGVDEWDKAKLPVVVKIRRPDKAYEFVGVNAIVSKSNDPAETTEDLVSLVNVLPLCNLCLD